MHSVLQIHCFEDAVPDRWSVHQGIHIDREIALERCAEGYQGVAKKAVQVRLARIQRNSWKLHLFEFFLWHLIYVLQKVGYQLWVLVCFRATLSEQTISDVFEGV